MDGSLECGAWTLKRTGGAVILKAIRSMWRSIEVWFETLDCREEEYFGYGDDRTALVRMLAKSLKRRLDPECTQPLEPEMIVEVPSCQPRSAQQAADATASEIPPPPTVPVQAQATAASFTSPQSHPSNALHLPFALPDEIYHDDHLPAIQSPVRASHPVRQWVAAGLAAIAVNAVSQLFTVQPLQSKVDRLSSELSEARSTVERLASETRILQARNTEVSAKLSQLTEGESLPVGRSVNVPDPYGPVTFTQWKREAARTDSRRSVELD